jgi:hypothetical protein
MLPHETLSMCSADMNVICAHDSIQTNPAAGLVRHFVSFKFQPSVSNETKAVPLHLPSPFMLVVALVVIITIKNTMMMSSHVARARDWMRYRR